jgi:hypothetical protein
MCYTAWRDVHPEVKEGLSDKHSDFKKIHSQFLDRFGREDGEKRYKKWLKDRKLDETRPYSMSQLKESYQWAKPLIKLLKEDKTGKTYKCDAHFAVNSMNKNIYTEEEVMQAVHSLPGKHIDLNHNLDWKIEGATILAANWEDRAVETLIHFTWEATDAKGRNVIQAIDEKEIDHVSIEAGAEKAIRTPEGIKAEGLEYKGLALIDQDQLPGIPLTRIMCLEGLTHLIFEELELEKTENEVKEKLEKKPEINFEEMSIEDIKKKIANLSTEIAQLDKKMYPEPEKTAATPKVSSEERTKLQAEYEMKRAELDAYRQALVQKTLAKATEGKDEDLEEISATYCTSCGKKLEKNACPNEKCDAFDKPVVVKEETLQLRKKLADTTEELTKKVRKIDEINEKLRKKDEKIIELTDKLAKTSKENLKIDIGKTQIKSLEEDLLNAKQYAKDAKKKATQYAEQLGKVERQKNQLEEELEKTEEKLAKTEGKLKKTRNDLNEESTKRAAAHQKVLNITQEISELKEENADTLDEKATDLRKISELGEKVSKIAKEKIALEKMIEDLKKEIKKRDDIIKEKCDAIKVSEAQSTRRHKMLKKHGIYEVDGKGNLVL